ncbi:MAG: 4-hydroxythreonine-4-phosphate dehydrogenase PdxA [Candidatus Omnitrophica bacterium]|nr:4-hydroxythreonine-4-phosphate dehydrogenase PdxA [Candidatus Omnitrophota bacterium]
MPISHTGSKAKPVICITVGDPAGIGPEVTKKALKSTELKGKADFFVVGEVFPRKRNRRECGRLSLEYLNTAFELVSTGRADALVTGPVCKEDINALRMDFRGHTEYLAGLSGCKKFAMMFVSDKLKVSTVTRHISLRDVSRCLSSKAIYDTVELTYQALRNNFSIKNPKIGVSGLNPHCGEGGILGKEEELIILPAIKKLKSISAGISGPHPADALLHDAYNKKFDAAICMYHDQALAAFKMISRDQGVNVTLGLPFIRTSVDHGTAFDIAGKGKADPGSMIAAIKLAIGFVKAC